MSIDQVPGASCGIADRRRVQVDAEVMIDRRQNFAIVDRS